MAPKKVVVKPIPAPTGIGAALSRSLTMIKKMTGPRSTPKTPKNVI